MWAPIFRFTKLTPGIVGLIHIKALRILHAASSHSLAFRLSFRHRWKLAGHCFAYLDGHGLQTFTDPGLCLVFTKSYYESLSFPSVVYQNRPT